MSCLYSSALLVLIQDGCSLPLVNKSVAIPREKTNGTKKPDTK